MISLKGKVVWIDLDGTMYCGDQLIDGALDFIQYLQQEQIPFYFITNNATRTHEENAAKLLSMGFENITAQQFFTSAMATAYYIKQHQIGKRMYCLGEAGLHEALVEEGLVIANTEVDVVVVGLDTHADYQKYCEAYLHLQQGAVLIGTNADRRLPDADRFHIGNGAVVEMLAYASEQDPIIIGKPMKHMMDAALAFADVAKETCVIIGDNIETDIMFGIAQNINTIFVETGVHTMLDLHNSGLIPTAAVHHLKELII